MRTILAAILCLGALSPACNPPAGADYPYDMFDRDVANLTQVMREGAGTGLRAENVVAKDDGLEHMEKLWGNVRNVRVSKKVHVAMRAYYLADIETTDGRTDSYVITYRPNQGRVEVGIRKQ
jgi:hypothetical protein